MKRLKIVTVCGCGLGSSLIAKMALEDVIAATDYSASIDTADGGSAAGIKCDFYVTTAEFAARLESTGIPIVVVTNFVNREELKEKLLAALEKYAGR